jgi:hypothetical protein
MSVFGLLSALIFAVRRPARLSPAERKAVEHKRATIPARFCSRLPHLIASGEAVAHPCRVLPVEALQAEAEGRFLIATLIMGRPAPGPIAHASRHLAHTMAVTPASNSLMSWRNSRYAARGPRRRIPFWKILRTEEKERVALSKPSD